MSDMNEIQRLLRLKRYETPGPNYVEETLQQFHRRQAAALIHRPLWKLALDRFQATLQPALAGPQFASAAVFGLVLISATLFLLPRLNPTKATSAQNVASTSPASAARDSLIRLEAQPLVGAVPVATEAVRPSSPRVAVNPDLEFVWLLSKGNVTIKSPQPSEAVAARQTDGPRYVIDAQPVSYEASISF